MTTAHFRLIGCYGFSIFVCVLTGAADLAESAALSIFYILDVFMKLKIVFNSDYVNSLFAVCQTRVFIF